MDSSFDGLAFSPADILLPKNCDLTKWAVVACDQYSSEPEYWERVSERVGSSPSSFRLILPEYCLDGPGVETDVLEINNTMTRYLKEGQFDLYKDAVIYTERTLSDGTVRRGFVGKIDLEDYDYESDSVSLIRATEGVVLSRIPPRIAVRKNAPIELPHSMLLYNDPSDSVMQSVCANKDSMRVLYDFDLMESGGHLKGYLLRENEKQILAGALHSIFLAGIGSVSENSSSIQFAVGDGNHSLATAKECFERQKRIYDREMWGKIPSRYTLTEIVNLYNSSLRFEPIHRVFFGVNEDKLLSDFLKFYPGAYFGKGIGHVFHYIRSGEDGYITVPNPTEELPVGTIQNFADVFLAENKGSMDYIHGDTAAAELAEKKGNIAFLLKTIEKESLFPAIQKNGVLPRKSFSMGNANDKRYYLEARKIR